MARPTSSIGSSSAILAPERYSRRLADQSANRIPGTTAGSRPPVSPGQIAARGALRSLQAREEGGSMPSVIVLVNAPNGEESPEISDFYSVNTPQGQAVIVFDDDERLEEVRSAVH